MDALSSSMGHAEVHEPHVDGIAVHEHDVLGLDVPVHHSPLVRMLESPAQLDADLEDVGVGETLLAEVLA